MERQRVCPKRISMLSIGTAQERFGSVWAVQVFAASGMKDLIATATWPITPSQLSIKIVKVVFGQGRKHRACIALRMELCGPIVQPLASQDQLPGPSMRQETAVSGWAWTPV